MIFDLKILTLKIYMLKEVISPPLAHPEVGEGWATDEVGEG